MPALRLAITTPQPVRGSCQFTVYNFAVHYTGKVVAPWIPRDHSSLLQKKNMLVAWH